MRTSADDSAMPPAAGSPGSSAPGPCPRAVRGARPGPRAPALSQAWRRGVCRATAACVAAVLACAARAGGDASPPEKTCDAAAVPATVERAIAGSVEAARWLSAYYATAACGVVDPSRSREWLAHAAAVGDDAAMAQLGYDFKSPYVGVTTFRCGSSTVRIETTCAAYDTREPHACYAQRLVFDGDRSAEYLFFNRDFRTDPFVVAWATCVAAPDEGWVVLESWNGGSGAHCDDCERTDYFTVRGRYLGSTESQAGRRIVPGMKVVSRKTTERIEAARAQRGRAGRIAVIRYPSGR